MGWRVLKVTFEVLPTAHYFKVKNPMRKSGCFSPGITLGEKSGPFVLHRFSPANLDWPMVDGLFVRYELFQPILSTMRVPQST